MDHQDRDREPTGETGPAPFAASPDAPSTEPAMSPSPESPENDEMPGVFALISGGLRRVEEKLNPLLVSLVVGVVALVPFVLAAWSLEGASPAFVSPLQWAFMALAFVWLLVLSIFNNGAVIYLLSHQEEPLSYRDGFAWAVRNFWNIAWIGILTSLVMVTATASFVIPALILAVYLLFSTISLAREGHTGLRAMVRSTDLVHGVFWRILGRLLLLLLLVIVAMWVVGLVFGLLGVVLGATGEVLSNLLGSLVQIVLGWLLIAILVQLFVFRATQKPAFVYEQHRSLALFYKIMAGLGLIIPVLAGGALLSIALSMMNNLSSGGLGGPDGEAQFEVLMEQLEQMEASGEFDNRESMDEEEFRRLQEELEAATPAQ